LGLRNHQISIIAERARADRLDSAREEEQDGDCAYAERNQHFGTHAADKGGRDFLDHINPDSLRVVEQAWIEPSLLEATPEQNVQFEREGYFVADRYDHSAQTPVFNRTISLRDSWGGQGGAGQ
jgi:hypothetical protein